MTSVLTDSLIAAEGGHHVVNELPFAPIWFGVIALVAFMALLGFLWSFRNTLALDPHAPKDGRPTAGHAGDAHADRRGSTTH